MVSAKINEDLYFFDETSGEWRTMPSIEDCVVTTTLSSYNPDYLGITNSYQICKEAVKNWKIEPVKWDFTPKTIINNPCNLRFPIKSVIFNDPRTIIYFENGDKSVVKVEPGQTFDKEKGFYAALLKYYMGGRGYFDMMNKWVYDEDK